MQFYNVKEWPYVAVIDPITGTVWLCDIFRRDLCEYVIRINEDQPAAGDLIFFECSISRRKYGSLEQTRLQHIL